jgi:hypothetical protein
MTSSVSICSNALIRLGDKPISSFQDPTQRAQNCSILYPEMRDAVLRKHPWNSATKRVVLAPLADAPAFDYPYQFQLPDDWLKTIQVGRLHVPLPYTVEANRILTFVNALPLVYIFRNTVEQTWESTLVDVMTAAMTAVLAYPITQSSSMMQAKTAEFVAALKEAKAINGQDDDEETLGDFPLLAGRFYNPTRAPGR